VLFVHNIYVKSVFILNSRFKAWLPLFGYCHPLRSQNALGGFLALLESAICE